MLPPSEDKPIASAALRSLRDWTPSWERWYRSLLPAYWIFLFCMTHFPRVNLGNVPSNFDKVMHIGAFGVLAAAYWKFFESFVRPVPAGFALRAAPVLIAYAALDEYLQQFVGRGTDVLDWLANSVGVVLGLGVCEWRRRATASG